MKMTYIILSMLIFSCAHKNKKQISDSNFLGLSYNEIKTSFDVLSEADQIINNVTYGAYKIDFKDYSYALLADKKSEKIVESVKIYPKPEISLRDGIYSSAYQPKCENKLISLKYNLEKKILALTKDNKIIFEGESCLILERLADDQNKKCLNRWNH